MIPLRSVFQVVRFAVELIVDVARGKDSAPPPNPVGLRYIDVERQAQASRNAGHEPKPAVPKRAP